MGPATHSATGETAASKFAEFYLNLLTPPEVRFPCRGRRFIALGDGSTEPSHLYGQLGTAFRDADPVLSRRLMGRVARQRPDAVRLFGSSAMAIDERLPSEDPALGSATFPGYYTVLRSGYGTPWESAAWIVNGDFYSDHRHSDAGSVVLYALGAPLCVNWSAMYSPHTPGAYYHSSVIPESKIGVAWNSDDTADLGGRWSLARGYCGAIHVSSRNERGGFEVQWRRDLLGLDRFD